MRAVIPHVDDLGGSHGANQAFLELARPGRVTCGSIIVPGPWFREIADAACADPSLDVGVHLTLTSEWETCRWAPISTVSRASG
ncbi:MAG: ChbG/HpnK family deacetylase, partial [Alphaproteobacteria bacterium]